MKRKDQAVIFDMDGVIVDNFKFHVKAWIVFGERHNIPIKEEQIMPLFGNTNSQILPLFFDTLSTEKSLVLAAEKEQIYREVFAQEVKPIAGLFELLETLKMANLPIAVATGGPRTNVDFVMKHTGFAKYFDVIVDDSMISRGKPSPEIFLKVATLLDVKPANCLVFEDAVHGIDAAISAGMKVIALTTTYPKEKLERANYIINDFTEISPELLKRYINL